MKKKVNENFDELRKIFKDNKIALSLIDEAIFMKNTLNELKSIIKTDGAVTSMCQGNYYIEREHPALKGYNTTIKNYNSVIKQINDMIPKNSEEEASDGFDEL